MKQTITETKEMAQKLAKDLEYMDEAELLHAWQIRCETMNYWDDEIYSMDFFDELFLSVNPLEIAMKIFHGDINPHHDFFKFDGYANLESSNYLSDFINLDELADEIMDNDDLADELVNAGLLEEWRNVDE